MTSINQHVLIKVFHRIAVVPSVIYRCVCVYVRVIDSQRNHQCNL